MYLTQGKTQGISSQLEYGHPVFVRFEHFKLVQVCCVQSALVFFFL